MQRTVLASPQVRDAMESHPDGVDAGRREAEAILRQMGHTLSPNISRVSAWFLRKVFRRIYGSIHIEPSGIERLKAAVAQGAVALIPTHRSYVDFLLVSYVVRFYF